MSLAGGGLAAPLYFTPSRPQGGGGGGGGGSRDRNPGQQAALGWVPHAIPATWHRPRICPAHCPRYGLSEALRLASQDGQHWLLHLDPDELLHPGGCGSAGSSRGIAGHASHAEQARQSLWHASPPKLIAGCCPAAAGGPAFSLTATLARQPPHVPAVRFMNFEGQPEAGDITNRIEQASRAMPLLQLP